MVISMILCTSYAQDTDVEFVETDHKNSVRLETGFPNSLANSAFKTQFAGLFDLRASYKRNLTKSIVFGAYGEFFSYDNTKSDSLHPTTKREIIRNNNYSTGLLFGWEKSSGRKAKFNMLANAGYTWTSFSRWDVTKEETIASYKDEGLNYGISLNWTYYIEEMFSVGPYASYQLTQFVYEPGLLQLTPNHNGKYSQHFFWGMIMSFGF